jgi:PAP2 superfamily
MKTSDSRTWGPELLAVAGLVFLAPIAVALRGGLLYAIGHNATLAANLGAALMIFFACRPSAREWTAVICLALVFRALYVTLDEPIGVYPGSFLLSWCAFLGVAAILVLGSRLARDPGRRRMEDFLAAALCLEGWIVFAYAMHLTVQYLPRTLDGVLYSFDASLGFKPSFALGSWLIGRPLLAAVTAVQYEVLFIAVMGTYAWKRRQGETERMLATIACVLLGGLVLYFLCPATGPGWAFPGKFPLHPPQAWSGLLRPMLVANAPRNAMPSLHIGLALVALWSTRGLGRVARIALGCFLAATVFSTLAMGEHYLIDLAVAVPYSVAVRAAVEARFRPMAIGAALTAAWIVAFRAPVNFSAWPAAASWILILLTVAIPLTADSSLVRVRRTPLRHNEPDAARV